MSDDKRQLDEAGNPIEETVVPAEAPPVEEEIGAKGTLGKDLTNSRAPADGPSAEEEPTDNGAAEDQAREQKNKAELDEAQREAARQAADAANPSPQNGNGIGGGNGSGGDGNNPDEPPQLSERQQRMKDHFGVLLPHEELTGINNMGRNVHGNSFAKYGDHATLTQDGGDGFRLRAHPQSPEARLAARHSAEMLRQKGFDTMVLDAKHGSPLGNIQWLEARKAGLEVEGFEPSPETFAAFREHQAAIVREQAAREQSEKLDRMLNGQTPPNQAPPKGPDDPNPPPNNSGPDSPPPAPDKGPDSPQGGPGQPPSAPEKGPESPTPSAPAAAEPADASKAQADTAQPEGQAPVNPTQTPADAPQSPAPQSPVPQAPVAETPAGKDPAKPDAKPEGQMRETVVNAAVDGAAMVATAKGVPPVVANAAAGVIKPVANKVVGAIGDKLNDPSFRSAMVNTAVNGAAAFAVSRGAPQPIVAGGAQFLKSAFDPKGGSTGGGTLGGDPLASKLSQLIGGKGPATASSIPVASNVASLDAWRQRDPQRVQKSGDLMRSLRSSTAMSAGEEPGRPKFTLIRNDEPTNRSNSRFDPADSKSARRVELMQRQGNTRRMEMAQKQKMDAAPRPQMPRRNG